MIDQPYSLDGKRVWVCGHKGMVGSAIIRQLQQENVIEILTVDRSQIDLTRQDQVEAWMETEKPDCIFLAAARVGGILANETYPAEFIYDNLMIASNVIHAAYKQAVEKLIFLGSSCIYPKFTEQPMKETALLTGALEPTNQWYAVAKIAGIKLAQAYRRQYGTDFISAMPTNLYGPGDNFHLENSHVIPALIQKVHQAKIEHSPSVELWGSGEIYREFMHVDDCAAALVFLMKHYSAESIINISQGEEVTIKALLETLMDMVGYKGSIDHDLSKPDGPPRKFMDGIKLKELGWTPYYSLQKGLEQTYEWMLENESLLRR